MPNVSNIPPSWQIVSHRHQSALRRCPMSATYQQAEIQSHTDFIAHFDGAQCLLQTNQLISSLTQTSQRTQKVPNVCNIRTSWHEVSHRHYAHLDGVQCLQNTNKLLSRVTQTSQRTQMVPSVCNIPTSEHQVSHRHHRALRWCLVSATYQKLASSLRQTSQRTQMVPSVCNGSTS